MTQKLTLLRCFVFSKCPSSRTSPAASFRRPHKQRVKVVFPAPLCPIMPSTSPRLTENPRLLKTACLSKAQERFSTDKPFCVPGRSAGGKCRVGDRKSTRLNSSHVSISYAVFCLKKKN